MNRQRTYRPDRSPYRESEDLYQPSNIIRSELSMLEEENAILKLKCMKVSDLQEKVQMVLKQNAQLLSENQKMARLLHQQKSENEIFRNKLDTLSAQKMGYLNEFEMERKKLLIELQRLGDDMGQLELQKSNQINQLKNSYQIELQTLKRQLHNSEASSEAEIRKYRDQIDKRQHELNDYINKLKRVTTQTDYEILKLKEDKEKLRAQLAYNEADHTKQIQSLKIKLENNYLEELEALKRAHISALEEAERENLRLKESLQERARQFDQIIGKFNKQKIGLEDNINYLKKDNESLRNKIVETQKLGQFELGDLKERLNALHQSEIDELIVKQQSHIQVLQQEMSRMQSVLHTKNLQIEQLIKDKVTNRNIFDSQVGRVKDDQSTLINKYKDLESKLNEVSSQAAAKLHDKEKQIQYLEDVLKDQKKSSDAEQTALQNSIEVLRQDLASQRMMFKEKEQVQKEEVANIKHQLAKTKLHNEQRETSLQKNVNQLKNELNGTSAQLSHKADSLQSKNKVLQKESDSLKNNISLRQKQIKALTERLKASGERESRLQAEIDDLRKKMIKRQQKSNQTINQQKTRLESTFTYSLESLKSDHQASLKLEANKYKDLQQKLRKKEIELTQLLKMYKKMTDQIQVLTQQEANKKDITLKFPGATADLIATKNLFDIYLKTKVLDVCGDALKQNMKKG